MPTGLDRAPNTRKRRGAIAAAILACVLVACGALFIASQPGPLGVVKPVADTMWGDYGGSPGGLKYSPLDQVDSANVSYLAVAWIYRNGDSARVAEGRQTYHAYEMTPILADNLLFGCTPLSRVFAVDPATGRQKWTFDPGLHPSDFGSTFVKCRGVAAWTDPDPAAPALCKHRIIYGTGDFRIIEFDTQTGAMCPGFGDGGQVKVDAGKPLRFPDEVQFPSPPAIVGDVAIFGSTMADIFRTDSPSGKVRAIDIRTGKTRWEIDPIPRDPNNPAAKTWSGDSAQTYGASNVWTFISVDREHRIAYLPTTTPSADWYGGGRLGENRNANSLVAVDTDTGKIIWSFQITHHDIFDYDLASQPILVDIKRNGQTIPAVVQLTKQSMIFVFNRLTGEPLFPIEERAVPTDTDLPGEHPWPTQPFVSKPAPLDLLGIKASDAWGFTFYDRGKCHDEIAAGRNEGLYTPPSQEGTLLMPSGAGGMNWGGGAVDPQSGLLIVPSFHAPAKLTMIPREKATGTSGVTDAIKGLTFPLYGTPYVGSLTFLLSPWGTPCTAPPWARLTAIDLSDGSVKWQVPLGSIQNHVPLLNRLPIDLPGLDYGAPFAGGPIVTGGGLVFIAATTDDRIRAFDVHTGRKLWQAALPASGQATPMTYAIGGRQYVVVAAGGHPLYQSTPGDYLVAYALPKQH